jgi:murein DD-endopeptidase MepM/ murein hydrolase activator NlpD
VTSEVPPTSGASGEGAPVSRSGVRSKRYGAPASSMEGSDGSSDGSKETSASLAKDTATDPEASASVEKSSASDEGASTELEDKPLPDRPVSPAPSSVIRPPMLVRRRAPEAPPAAPRSVNPGSLATRYPMPGPNEPEPAPSPLARPPAGGIYLSPRMTAIFGGLFGLAMVTSVVALLIQVVPPRDERGIASGSASAQASGSAAASRAAPESKKRQRVVIPGPWRVADLEKDPSVTVASGGMDRKTLMEVLGDKGVPKAQVYRILKAFDGQRKFDKSGRRDKFTVAIERGTQRVKAFEYEVSPSEIYQTREGNDGLLSPGQKLDLKIAEGEMSGAFYVGPDLASSVGSGGFDDGFVTAMDEALSGHLSTESFEEGGTVRAIAVEETALGLFSRYKRIVALEYRPPDPSAKPTRIYTFNGQEARGYWDERGKQPHSGGWRSPVPGAPVTSRFNPKRMHPILHKIMPHQGTDFGAVMGTPVYAAYKGVVWFVGPHGPTGNWVGINHPNGVETGYAHLSRFAPGLKAGDKVGTHQLVGYVGSTGRSTAPHLHFSARKNGVFFDAETLQLDGERVVPAVDRQAFLAAKAELDRRIEAIPLPEPPAEASRPVAAAMAAESAIAGPPSSTDVGAAGSGKSSRHAAIVASPAALASAAAEPGIHPKGFVEDGSEDDADPAPVPVAPGASAAAPGKAAPPDPAEEDDDTK